MQEELQALAQQIGKKLADQGRAIEGGWRCYKMLVMPKGASRIQEDETQQAFYAGAQHALFTLMGALDPDAEPTESDEKRLEMMSAELEKWGRDFARKYGLAPAEKAH